MSTGGGATLTINLNTTGAAPPASPPGTAGGGPPPSSNQQRPSGFRQVARQDATDRLISKATRRIPGSEMFLAGAMLSGRAERGVRSSGAGAAFSSAMAGASMVGSGPRGVASMLPGAVGAAGAALMGPVGLGVAGALVTLGAAVLAAREAIKLHTKFMDTALKSVRGTGIVTGLEMQAEARLQMEREIRALRRGPELTDLITARTERQSSFDQLKETIGFEFEKGLRPFADFAADLSEIAAYEGGEFTREGPVMQLSKWLNENIDFTFGIGGQLEGIRKDLGDVADAARDQRAQDAQKQLQDIYKEALNPFKDDVQPYETGTAEAGRMNPLT